MPEALSDEPFLGYTFQRHPLLVPRMWFLDRHLYPLMVWGHQPVDGGTWVTDARGNAERLVAEQYGKLHNWRKDFGTAELVKMGTPGSSIRYNHQGGEWSAVWKLTDTVIEHVTTFGHDDTWRLGIWPD